MKNIFDIIQSEQTPKVPEIGNIKEFIKENNEIINDFKEYAEIKSNAIGLAANQCRLNFESRFMLRLAAIKNSKSHERPCIIAIDPKITRKYGMTRTKIEGCLTWVGKLIIAERNHFIDIEYYNTEGKLIKETHNGFQAQVWQHEINHLNGIEEKVIMRNEVPPVTSEGIGRNDICPCGSGKKFKKCCVEL